MKGKFNAVVILRRLGPGRPLHLLAVGPEADREEVDEMARVTGGG
ncbi:hypothetical protein ACWC9U_18790 [Streptomyces sp. 900116325]